MRRGGSKRDANEKQIIAAVKRWPFGGSVLQLDERNAPDLVVGFKCSFDYCCGHSLLWEVKNPMGPQGGDSQDGQHLSHGQADWVQAWEGQYDVVRSELQAWAKIASVYCRWSRDQIKQSAAFSEMIDSVGQEG